MSKINNLADLGDLYASIQKSVTKETPSKAPATILNTNTLMYLPEAAQDIGADTKVELADKKKSGPHGADNFEPVKKAKKEGNAFGKAVADAKAAGKHTGDKIEVPGSDEKVTLKEENEEAETEEHEDSETEAEEKKEHAAEEKVEENVETTTGSNKYKKQQFTMPKSKFDKLYEDAVNNIPFAEEENMTPIEPGPDAGLDAPDADADMAPAEDIITHDEAIELARKLLAFLEKDKAHDVDTGTLGGEEGDMGAGEEEAPVMEEVEAEDLGHAGVGSGAKSEQLKDGHKLKTVGSGVVTQKGGKASEQGAPSTKEEPTPKAAKDSDRIKDGTKLHKVGSGTVTKTGADLFAN